MDGEACGGSLPTDAVGGAKRPIRDAAETKNTRLETS
jgi:hypothetical protein